MGLLGAGLTPRGEPKEQLGAPDPAPRPMVVMVPGSCVATPWPFAALRAPKGQVRHISRIWEIISGRPQTPAALSFPFTGAGVCCQGKWIRAFRAPLNLMFRERRSFSQSSCCSCAVPRPMASTWAYTDTGAQRAGPRSRAPFTWSTGSRGDGSYESSSRSPVPGRLGMVRDGTAPRSAWLRGN